MSSITTIQENNDSSKATRLLFNRYFSNEIAYSSSQVDSVIGFFRKRGFDELAAISVSTILLQQAKADGVNVNSLLDTLDGFDKVKLSTLVTAILNANRSKLSKLGYKAEVNYDKVEARNILY
jgi:hypothetical protein